MSLKGEPGVLDIRQVGLTVGIDLASRPDAYGKRGYDAMGHGFHEEGIMLRGMADALAMSPPLIVTEEQIDEMVDKTRRVIKAVM